MAFNRNDRDLEIVSGIFASQENLYNLFDALQGLGIGRDDISVLMSEQTRAHYKDFSYPGQFSDTDNVTTGGEAFVQTTKLPEGAATGGLTGGVVGAIIGGLTLVGSVLLPGVGLLVAGPLVGAITGGAIGTAAGGLVGALAGLGIPENEAKYYQDSIQQPGNILVVSHVPKDLKNEVRKIFETCGAQSVKIGG